MGAVEMYFRSESEALRYARVPSRNRLMWVGPVVFFLFPTWRMVTGVTRIPESAHQLRALLSALLVIVHFLAVAVAYGLCWYFLRRSDQRLAAWFPRRITYSGQRRLRDFADVVILAVCAFSYLGGTVLSLIAGLSGDDVEGVPIGFLALAGIGLFAIMTMLNVRSVLNRPTLAVDQQTLLIDDYYRRKDLRLALLPFPLMAGLILPGWTPVGFAALTAVLWFVVTMLRPNVLPMVSAIQPAAIPWPGSPPASRGLQ
jgi:TRAP-type C4-dicarboxylate transport system permease small subunit